LDPSASEAALNTINNCRSDNREAPYLVLATNLSSTVFAASSEFQTQRSPSPSALLSHYSSGASEAALNTIKTLEFLWCF
jgi:hypothetical protein